MPFPELDEFFALLLQSGGHAGIQQALQAIMPRPGARLGPALLFFLAAMRAGGLERWLGKDGVQTLNRLKHNGAARLGRELAGGGRGALSGGGELVEAAGSNWRVYGLPLQLDSGIEALRLYLRQQQDRRDEHNPDGDDPDQDGEGRGGKGSGRFVLEAAFSRLGAIQFDGLVREKSLDLIIRSSQPLGQDLRDGVRGIFARVLSGIGYAGHVDFHVAKRLSFTPSPAAHTGSTGVPGSGLMV